MEVTNRWMLSGSARVPGSRSRGSGFHFSYEILFNQRFIASQSDDASPPARASRAAIFSARSRRLGARYGHGRYRVLALHEGRRAFQPLHPVHGSGRVAGVFPHLWRGLDQLVPSLEAHLWPCEHLVGANAGRELHLHFGARLSRSFCGQQAPLHSCGARQRALRGSLARRFSH